MTAGAPADSVPGPANLAFEIRPIRADDKEALRDGFERLSEESRYRRFLSAHARLTDAELRYFTEIDHHDHEALVAVDPVTGQGVGVARYVRSSVDPRQAEMAVAVVDDWQRRGVGSRLMEALADRARSEGITSFTALMLANNESMLRLIADLGVVRDVHYEPDTVQLTVDLPMQGLGRLARLLSAAARGDIDALGSRHLPALSHPASLGPAPKRSPRRDR